MGNKEVNKDLIVDWNRFKSNSKGKLLGKARNSYAEFYKMLYKIDFELVSDYIGNKEKVELVYKFNHDIKLNVRPNSFKTQTYKAILNFKEKLIKNNDKFIGFIGLTNGKLIAKFKTFDNGKVEMDIANYNQ
ncbi:MAG: hypothetical protein E6182_09995 [Clostridioides difficile]|nr:hypothetical protein [Clostridioides difficile]